MGSELNTFRPLWAVALAAGLTAGLMTTGAVPALANGCAETFSGGSGTSADPFEIRTRSDLNDLQGDSACWGYEFQQARDISMEADTWTATIGDSTTGFTGVYDGRGHVISDLTIQKNSGSAGLFGVVDTGGEVKNLGFTGAVAGGGSDDVGGLVGKVYGGSVSNSYTTGAVTGGTAYAYMGGLVGFLDGGGSVSDSYATGTVAGGDGASAGGLVGYGNGSSVVRSYAAGAVSAGVGARVGGLLGFPNYSSVSDSYATGAVTVTSGTGSVVGGLIGDNQGSSVSNSYSTGAVSISGGTDATVGGLDAYSNGTTTTSFWDTQTSGQQSSYSGTGKTTAQMTSYSTYADASWSIADGYSSSTTWGICSEANSGYPFLVGTQPTNPCNVDPQAALAEFTYVLPDGRECTSISPQRVVIGTVHALPGREALCQTRAGSRVAGWLVPVPAGFTGTGSSARPFAPGDKVFVSGSQRFTLVPFEQVLRVDYDANIATSNTCTPANLTHTSNGGRLAHSWVPREIYSMARTPAQSPCQPAGYELTGWNTAGDGTGDTVEPGAPLPADWHTQNINHHTLYAMWNPT